MLSKKTGAFKSGCLVAMILMSLCLTPLFGKQSVDEKQDDRESEKSKDDEIQVTVQQQDPEGVNGTTSGENWSPIYPRRLISRYRPPFDSMMDDDVDLPSTLQSAADVVRNSTVTIRVDRPKNTNSDAPQPACDSVAVFSGVLIRKGYVATTLFLPASSEVKVRITLPNGKQTTGTPKILDEYTGLSILRIDDDSVPSLKLCSASAPRTGQWIVSGAAWGRKAALVSSGIISGIGYRLPNSDLEPPPLVVCDMRAAQTSKGAAIVGMDGKMAGIIISVSDDNRWVYAVPTLYLHRLVFSMTSDDFQNLKPDEVLVLRRQMPRIGISIKEDVGSRKILVQWLEESGPAENAGLRVGDEIKTVDGIEVRRGYDVVRDFLMRQPGDRIDIGIRRGEEELKKTVVLGESQKTRKRMVAKISDITGAQIKLAGNGFEMTECRQLMTFAEHNLLPPPCSRDQRFEELNKLLADERDKNRKMQKRIEQLEAKLDRIIDLIGNK